jgi:hypothetical protein
MSDVKIVLKRAGANVEVRLAGQMDERANYSTIDLNGVAAADFDFEGVTMINSKGIQVWKDFMRSVPDNVRVTYKRCPLKVVNQLNLFPSFNGGKVVKVTSFFAPYFCEACDKPHTALLDTATHFPEGKPVAAPSIDCESCKKPLEFDAIPQKYFLFLRRAV